MSKKRIIVQQQVDYRGITREPWYTLDIPNVETLSMFTTMFQNWFQNQDANYGYFMKSLIAGDLEAMNYYMNRVALATFSYCLLYTSPSPRDS
mgnify:CR=1 FL=1